MERHAFIVEGYCSALQVIYNARTALVTCSTK